MGRKAGVAAEETRAALLAAGARVFARRGYDGASIAEITSEASLTSGAVYAHYGSKAELFLAVIEVYVDHDLDRLLGDIDLADALTAIGGTFDQREPTETSLLVAAIIAARNDAEVGRLLSGQMTDRERIFRSLIGDAQEHGSLDDDVSAAAIARLSLMLSIGSLVVGSLGLGEIDHDEWTALMQKLVGAFRAGTLSGDASVKGGGDRWLRT